MVYGLVLDKLREKLPKIKGSRTYLVQIPRRGGSILLGKIKARDVADAQKTLLENINAFMQNPAVKTAKYFHLIDVETGEKYKVENPLYSGSDEEETSSKSSKKKQDVDIEDLKNMLNLELAEQLGKTMISSMSVAMQSMGRTLGELMSELMRTQVEAMKQMILNQQPQQQPSTIELLKVLIEAVKEWPRLKKYAPEILRSFSQALTEKQEVEQSGSNKQAENTSE